MSRQNFCHFQSLRKVSFSEDEELENLFSKLILEEVGVSRTGNVSDPRRDYIEVPDTVTYEWTRTLTHKEFYRLGIADAGIARQDWYKREMAKRRDFYEGILRLPSIASDDAFLLECTRLASLEPRHSWFPTLTWQQYESNPEMLKRFTFSTKQLSIIAGTLPDIKVVKLVKRQRIKRPRGGAAAAAAASRPPGDPFNQASLDQLTRLEFLLCQPRLVRNGIDYITIVNNPELKVFICSGNLLLQISFGLPHFNNPNLEYIDCSDCGLSDALYTNGCPNLIHLDCSRNCIYYLDLSTNTQIQVLKSLQKPLRQCGGLQPIQYRNLSEYRKATMTPEERKADNKRKRMEKKVREKELKPQLAAAIREMFQDGVPRTGKEIKNLLKQRGFSLRSITLIKETIGGVTHYNPETGRYSLEDIRPSAEWYLNQERGRNNNKPPYQLLTDAEHVEWTRRKKEHKDTVRDLEEQIRFRSEAQKRILQNERSENGLDFRYNRDYNGRWETFAERNFRENSKSEEVKEQERVNNSWRNGRRETNWEAFQRELAETRENIFNTGISETNDGRDRRMQYETEKAEDDKFFEDKQDQMDILELKEEEWLRREDLRYKQTLRGQIEQRGGGGAKRAQAADEREEKAVIARAERRKRTREKKAKRKNVYYSENDLQRRADEERQRRADERTLKLFDGEELEEKLRQENERYRQWLEEQQRLEIERERNYSHYRNEVRGKVRDNPYKVTA